MTRDTERAIRKLERKVQVRLRMAFDLLANDPRPPGAVKMAGMSGNTWRVRVGDYRIVYDIDDGQLVVLVIRAAHRREVYRGM